MLNLNEVDESNQTISRQRFQDKSLEVLFSKKSNHAVRLSIPHHGLFQNKQNQLITVPIKEYSNKFLRQKKREDSQIINKRKEPFPCSHLYHNRKLISQFKKYKAKPKKSKNPSNNQNTDFIIYNLLFEKDDSSIPTDGQRKTIFGTFTENFAENPSKNVNEESSLFEKGWKTTKNGSLFQVKKEIYDKICQKEKGLIPEYRKKCKTFADSANYENHDTEKKQEKISTSRALEKYSKIIKVNPEHGKIEKMKIKKQLAKSLRFQSCDKGEIETKQITLAKKQVRTTNKNMFNCREQSIQKIHTSIDYDNKQNQMEDDLMKTPDRLKMHQGKLSFISSKVGMFSSGVKFKKLRKFSHQVESNKRCITEQKRNQQADNTFDDFQINGWDINL